MLGTAHGKILVVGRDEIISKTLLRGCVVHYYFTRAFLLVPTSPRQRFVIHPIVDFYMRRDLMD